MCFLFGVFYFIEYEMILVEYELLFGIIIGYFLSEKKMCLNKKIIEIEILWWVIVRMCVNNVVCVKFIVLFVIIEIM